MGCSASAPVGVSRHHHHTHLRPAKRPNTCITSGDSVTITPAMSTIRSRRFSYAEAPRQDTEGGSGSRVSSGCVDTLFDAYGKPTEQVGYTDGHYCVTNADRREAARCSSSLLYGEILASGVTKLMDTQHLHAANAQVLYDLGMGVGKLCLQTFVQFPNLRLVFGIELAFSRYKMAEEALLRLVTVQPDSFEVEAMEAGCFIRVCTVPSKDRPLRAAGRCRRRVIELRRGNMWTVRGLNAVDIVVLHTELTATSLSKVNRTINELHRGARFVTYQDISCWSGAPAPYKQLEANRSERDQFATSWSSIKGHHLYCWEKTTSARRLCDSDSSVLEESKEGVSAPH